MTLQTSPAGTPTQYLSDEQLAESFPAVAKLVFALEDVARRDPSQGTQAIARALAEYFRTAD